MASSPEEPTTTIKATCHCKAINLTLNYPNSTLPLPRSLCLCKTCRQLSGGPFGCSYIPLPSSLQTQQPPNFNLDNKDLTSYKTSDCVTRYFCTKCGAHVLVYDEYLLEKGLWAVATGILDKTEGVVKWEGCQYVEDTIDGGVSVWFKEIVDSSVEGGKRALKSRIGRNGNETFKPQKQKQQQQLSKVESGEEERLHAQCHCGGVKFYITRPNEDSKKTNATFPDLMIPCHAGAFAGNPDSIPWYLRDNDTKYLAGTCNCESCRLILGFEVQSWAFIPKCNIFQEDGKPIDFRMGTLKRYVSSEGVWRNFCGSCGATCFWNAEWREDVVDVSTGLFIPPQGEGSRVEAWLDWWTERISFVEEAVSTSLMMSLAEGLKEWGLNRESKLNSCPT